MGGERNDMSTDEMMFWNNWPQLLPLYAAIADRLTERYPDMKIKVAKTQISFYNRHLFAMASPPARRRKDWPKEFVMISFGLPYALDSERIAVCVQAYPNRWTHHVIVKSADEMDETLLGWIHEAYLFSQGKR